ncbi:MAG: oligoendopeptidase F [Vallitaleaceae bacterium]|nr:oligoendopeptidase F [Vallitaleaceae bacterium]
MKELKSRKDVDPKYTWNLRDIIQSQEEWESEFTSIKESLPHLVSYQGKLTESSDSLYRILSDIDTLLIRLYRLYVYSNMNLHEDTSNTDAQALVQRIGNLEASVSTSLAFLEPELMSADETLLQNYINTNQNLASYRHYFDNMLRQKAHILPKEQEELLSLTKDFSTSPSDIFSMFMNADLVFPEILDENGNKVRLTHGSYVPFMESSKVEVRKAAFEAMYQTIEASKNTLTSIYLASLKKDVFFARARKFNSCCEGSLFANNIHLSVYDNLVDVVHKNLPLLHRYVSLRKKMLQVNELHMYDLYVPLISSVDEEVSIEEAKSIVLSALTPLGEDYQRVLEEGFSSSWIDVYENKGKRSGAYSWGCYGSHPYVLLNFQSTLDHVFTLAHEMGHALHTYYSNQTQPYHYHSYPTFLAEVASTVNENLLIHDLLEKTLDKKKRMYLINHYLESFRGTLYRQVMFAEFERITHNLVEKDEAITVDVLNKIYLELNQKYYGSDMVVDELIQYEWARIPHFYRSFYVYQYATGFSAAVTLSELILDKDNYDLDQYLNFLKSGSSKYPIETLQLAGVDMSSTEPIEKALKVFERLLNEMESLL